MVDPQFIRNFCIIAHIDHGKSTLADRLLQKTGLVSDRDFKNQMLDTMDIERERGITIKSQAVMLPYLAKNGNRYVLNLLDTPGHVDFSYEVSRAIGSCEGALLLIDASQGVEAQTLSNLFLAMESDLHIIPIINKIDLPAADVDEIKRQIDQDLGLDSNAAVLVSAKTGFGVQDVLEAIIKYIPSPKDTVNLSLQANIFDCHYDSYCGVVVHVRVFQGTVRPGQTIYLMHSKTDYKVEKTGYFQLKLVETSELSAGEVGYLIAGIKSVGDVHVGDTITDKNNLCSHPLAGFKIAKPVVFSSIYPVSSDQLGDLNEAMAKLKLNDASFVFEKDSSTVLGVGFRCGFLGLLHLEVIQERLEREFYLNVLLTSPSVVYRFFDKKGNVFMLDNPIHFPDLSKIDKVEEPIIIARIITPKEYIGTIMTLCMSKRGIQNNIQYLDMKRVEMNYTLPLAEILFDFYDQLKSCSRGYASFDYEEAGFLTTDLVKLDILINGQIVDAMSQLVHRDSASYRAHNICECLREEIPRHQFKIPIQGAIGSTIIARETISAFRKDVTAKCYGGDITRKRKLLEKQKEGKKRMKMIGNIELPQSAFLAVLKSKVSRES